MNKKEVFYLLAIKDILEIFAEQELGCTYDLNIPVILNYMDSDRFVVNCIEATTKEDIYQLMTDEILNGYPVWDLLVIPEWTKKMLDKGFETKAKIEEENQKKKYKWLTCRSFEENETGFGTFCRCTFKEEKAQRTRHFELKRHGPFELKTICNNYVYDENKA